MSKNLKPYLKAWSLRQEGKKLREIGEIMGFSTERARTLVSYINMKIKYTKPLSNELKLLLLKYRQNSKTIIKSCLP